jgi:hypothetical protein
MKSNCIIRYVVLYALLFASVNFDKKINRSNQLAIGGPIIVKLKPLA